MYVLEALDEVEDSEAVVAGGREAPLAAGDAVEQLHLQGVFHLGVRALRRDRLELGEPPAVLQHLRVKIYGGRRQRLDRDARHDRGAVQPNFFPGPPLLRSSLHRQKHRRRETRKAQPHELPHGRGRWYFNDSSISQFSRLRRPGQFRRRFREKKTLLLPQYCVRAMGKRNGETPTC